MITIDLLFEGLLILNNIDNLFTTAVFLINLLNINASYCLNRILIFVFNHLIMTLIALVHIAYL